ncbi:MAG: CDP-glycerol glycerophosphotransferase family protein [Halioglobus sp.]
MRKIFQFFRNLSNVVAFNQLPKASRRVVFYSEGGTYWVHLGALLKAFLQRSDVGVCYISSNVDDPGLKLEHPQLTTFLIDEGAIRNWLFENIDTDVMVMTMPDIDQYQVKRSRHNVHYVYTQHSLVSLHMVYRPGAMDGYDSIFCAGPHHLEEIRMLQQQRNFASKNLVEHGYPRLDEVIAGRPSAVDPKSITNVTGAGRPKQTEGATVLLAPSWGAESITDTVALPLIEALLADNFRVIFRPHPQSRKFSLDAINAILNSVGQHEYFEYEGDVTGTESLYRSDIMICDWSGAALDYAFGLEKPVLFIDVPRKVNNPEYESLPLEPFEVGIRETIGTVITPSDIASVGDYMRYLLSRDMASEIRAARDASVFNVGSSDTVGADALLEILANQSR